MKWCKSFLSILFDIVFGFLALFFILLIGHIIIVVSMLALSVWLIVNSVQAVYKAFVRIK